MTPDERQFLLTAAWLFARHGRRDRARRLFDALAEDDPRDGTAAAALAELALDEGDPARALTLLRAADIPPSLEHAAAVLETRALQHSGKPAEAAARWQRWLETRKGPARRWIAP